MPGELVDRWGRYKLPDPDSGEVHPWTRTTTLAKAIEDNYHLHKWEMRSVVTGLMQDEDLQALALGTDFNNKKQWDSIFDQAKAAAKSSASSNRGTALHAFAERRDQGQKVRATPKYERDVDAYQRKLAELGVVIDKRYIERVTVVPELGVAGTMDRIARLTPASKFFESEGMHYIADLKTGSKVDFAMSFAIQLAIYAHGRGLWNFFDEAYDPMPEQLNLDRAIIIHLPAGEAKPALYWVDIATGWEMALTCKNVREWRKRRDWLTPFEEV